MNDDVAGSHVMPGVAPPQARRPEEPAAAAPSTSASPAAVAPTAPSTAVASPAAASEHGGRAGGARSGPGEVTMCAYREGRLVEEGFSLADARRYRGDDGVVLWLDLRAPGPGQLRAVAEELRLDPHAVEDALSAGERAKIDRYPTHLFLNTYAVRVDAASGALLPGDLGVHRGASTRHRPSGRCVGRPGILAGRGVDLRPGIPVRRGLPVWCGVSVRCDVVIR